MDVERKALYNLLRMNWLKNPSLDVEPWQVEDYAKFPKEELFRRLSKLHVNLNEVYFLAYADKADTPEDLTDMLVDVEASVAVHDQVYLLLFELWSRLIPERPSLSIVCDDLDRQINLYDSDSDMEEDALEEIQDALANLQDILEENVDVGEEEHQAFALIAVRCANDIEAFLYDFISDRIDEENEVYAYELIEGFSPYVKDSKWFDFLKVRTLGLSDMDAANELLAELYENYANEYGLELFLETLAFMVKGGMDELFLQVLENTVKVLDTEGDFQDLLQICADYLECLDLDHEEHNIQDLLKARQEKSTDLPIDLDDADLKQLIDLVSSVVKTGGLD